MILISALFWLACAFAAFLVAGFKGRSGCGFAILTLMFGPLGLIAAAIASPIRRD